MLANVSGGIPRADITIVGAGPAGCLAASLLARAGCDVAILEEHPEVGLPAHCTGIVTPDIHGVLDVPDRLVVRRIARVRVTASDGASAVVPSADLVLDRVAFDRHLAAAALDAGARLLRGHRFRGFGEPGTIRVAAHGTERSMETRLLVGADGPCSAVARSAGMFARRRFYAGAQVRLRGGFHADTYDVYLTVPQFFGWVVPETPGVARVGVAARAGSARVLEELLARIGPWQQIIDRQRGLIPIYDPACPVSGRRNGIDVRLIGDAATLVKATTGGGLVPGLASARALAASELAASSYERALAPIRRRMAAHLALRQMLNAFTDRDYARLVQLCSRDRVAAALARGSRDRPVALLAELARAEPGLAGLGATLLWRWLASAGRRGTPDLLEPRFATMEGKG